MSMLGLLQKRGLEAEMLNSETDHFEARVRMVSREQDRDDYDLAAHTLVNRIETESTHQN